MLQALQNKHGLKAMQLYEIAETQNEIITLKCGKQIIRIPYQLLRDIKTREADNDAEGF